MNHVNKIIKKSPNLGEGARNLPRHWLWEWLGICNMKNLFQNTFKRKLQAVCYHWHIRSSLLHNFGNTSLKSKGYFSVINSVNTTKQFPYFVIKHLEMQWDSDQILAGSHPNPYGLQDKFLFTTYLRQFI